MDDDTRQSELGQAEPGQSELGAFLRSRRERLSPAQVGLPSGLRRRVRGLRREEVAELAGVGTTWYTWLEQGRDVRASAQVLSALAQALRLDAVEKQHLFTLNDCGTHCAETLPTERVEEPLHRMLESLVGQPAYVLGRRWDILAWNDAAVALFGDYGKLEGDARNIMHLVFANDAHRKLLVDWNELAQTALATFRADSARYSGDPEFARLITTLMRASAEFRLWWPRHEVVQNLATTKRIEHPRCGRMAFEHTSFTVTNHPDMKLVVYTPLELEDSRSKLAALLHR
jgi:transcriptional regulator with XRE-family HTH domain